ncbi:MAG: hypothetical protein JWM05_525 [Acidimicrobiales bacterium]|nr:hypothetical protein [Acidimicrobiales bacterium]
MRLKRAGRLAAAVAALVAITACEPPPPPPRAPYRDASNGTSTYRGWFEGGKIWFGDLGDPHIVRVGDTYYAYSSPTAGRYLPVVTSTDLITWTIHPRWSKAGPPGTPGYSVANDPAIPYEIRTGPGTEWTRYDNNDALVSVASWGRYEPEGAWIKRTIWAPGVAQIGSSWFAYSAVRTSATSDDPHGFGRFCLTAAKAPSPLGPFRDVSGTSPIQCQPASTDPAGSIDPYPFIDDGASGTPYLLWKAAGKIGSHPSALYSVKLGTDGKPVPGAAPVKLLETREGGWEGATIENPSMVRYQGRYYLFYSGNYSGVDDAYGHSRYGTGYALCPQGPRAPCQRMTVSSPLLGSTSTEQGPGGASPVVTAAGNLRLVYAFFWPGEDRSEFSAEHSRHPRRMNVASLTASSDGTLTASRRTWQPGI